MNKKIILLLIIFFLTSCYDHHELNDIAILAATEINKIDNNYIVSAQIVDSKSSDNIEYLVYTSSAKTLASAYRQITKKTSKYLYSDHIQVMIINENIAKEDITEILDFFLRKPTVRTEFKVLIGKDNDILSKTTKSSKPNIIDNLKTNTKYLGTSNLVSFNDLTNMIVNPNTEIILPSIKIKNNQESEYNLDNLAIFKNNKLLGYLTKDESITYNIIKNNNINNIITYECDKDKYISLEIVSSKSKIIPKDNTINIHIKLTTSINETDCKINNKNLEKNINNYLNKKIKNNINNIRNTYNSDIFGFLDEIYKHDYKMYKKISKNYYKNTYKNIKINVDTKTNIISTGNITEVSNEKS